MECWSTIRRAPTTLIIVDWSILWYFDLQTETWDKCVWCVTKVCPADIVVSALISSFFSSQSTLHCISHTLTLAWPGVQHIAQRHFDGSLESNYRPHNWCTTAVPPCWPHCTEYRHLWALCTNPVISQRIKTSEDNTLRIRQDVIFPGLIIKGSNFFQSSLTGLNQHEIQRKVMAQQYYVHCVHVYMYTCLCEVYTACLHLYLYNNNI